MPCSDNGESGYYAHITIAGLKEKLRETSAVACALVNEILRHQEGEAMIRSAEEKSRANIKDFIKDHAEQDKERLLRNMEKDYSEDELKIIRALFKEGKL